LSRFLLLRCILVPVPKEYFFKTSVIAFVVGLLTAAILIIDGPFIGSHLISPETLVHMIDTMRKEVPITLL
jgi:hypothetical protein